MRHSVVLSLSALALASLTGTLVHAVTSDRHVVVISIDGFPAELWRRKDLPAPTLRRLAADGAAADAMTVVNPSLTWPNHTTLVTGVSPRRHGVFDNGLVARHDPNGPPTIDPGVDKTRLVHAPTVYDLAHAAGLTTADSNWPAILRAPTITWSFPEFPRADGALVKEMIAAGAITGADIDAMQYGRPTNLPWHDEKWLGAATFIVKRYHPHLLLYHILTTDSVHHTHGPSGVASFAAIGFADRLVAELVRAVDEAGLRANTTFVVTTDHGFKKANRVSYPNVALKQAGLLQAAGPRIASCEVCVKAHGGVAYAFITNAARRAELEPRVRTLLAGCEGVMDVIDRDGAQALGYPDCTDDPAVADFILYPGEGFSFSESAIGDLQSAPLPATSGTHGGKASDPQLEGVFLISGRGVRHGVSLGHIRNLDVAPTIAHVLGIPMPDVEGRVLTEALDEKGAAP